MMASERKLPEGWEHRSVAQIAETIQSGFACNKKNQVVGGYVHLRTNNVGTNFKLNISELVTINPTLVDNKRSKLIKGDIIFNNTNSQELVGKTCLIEQDYNFAYSNHLTKIEVNEDMLPAFFVYYFQYLHFSGFFYRICKRWIGQAGVNTTKLKTIEIPVPPLEEQERIVAKLDALFEKINTINSELILLKYNNSRLLRDLLHNAFDRCIDKWPKNPFDEICKFIDYRGRTPQKTSEGIPLITAKNVRMGKLNAHPYEYISEADYDSWMTRGIPRKGDILFTTEAPLGNVAILDTNAKRVFAQRLVILQPIIDSIRRRFLYYFLLSPQFQEILTQHSTGTTVKGIKTKVMKKFDIPIPSSEEQNAIVNLLDSFMDEHSKYQNIIASYIEQVVYLKSSLLDAAFRGQLTQVGPPVG